MSMAWLSAFGLACAAGEGLPETLENLRKGASPGMAATDRWTPGRPLHCGQVTGELPSLEGYPREMRSRNNALALRACLQIDGAIASARARFGARRVAVVAATSTSGMAEAEAAFAQLHGQGAFPPGFAYAQQELGSPAEFLARAFGLAGPAFTVSTACSSSAKALAAARRLLRLGVCDAVLAGGADTLCAFTLRGFSSLGVLSADPALPFSRNRKGINIGEAAAFFLLRRDDGPVRLAGAGETCDAYNVSAPLPGGEGARDAMRSALRDAGLSPAAIGYVNLHGTGTPQNDAMEAKAMAEVFPDGVPCSSTKGLTGHTLGAAGALEAGFCWALLAGLSGVPGLAGDGWLPQHTWDGVADPELARVDLVPPAFRGAAQPRCAMSNVFGFGGTNVSLVLEAA
jgi:3-oxoacyl-[acyl-carrier-protein] synthase I